MGKGVKASLHPPASSSLSLAVLVTQDIVIESERRKARRQRQENKEYKSNCNTEILKGET